MLNALPHQLKQTCLNVWHFIKHPHDVPDENISQVGKVRVLLQVLLIDLAICTALVGVLEAINYFELYDMDEHAVTQVMRDLPVWGALLLGVLVVPFFEELIFRFGLRFRQSFVTFVLALILLAAGFLLFKALPLLWALGATLLLAAALVLYLLNAYTLGIYLEQKWSKGFRFIFYAAAFLFGLIHITNYKYSTAILLLAPILVSPQILGGLLMGYMCVKYGFMWGFYLHAAHNLVFITLGFLFLGNLKEKLNINHENYTLKVEEHMRDDATAGSSSFTSRDSVAFVNTKLGGVVEQLLRTQHITIKQSEGERLTRHINLSYKNHGADSSQNAQHILTELQKLYNFEVTVENVQQEVWEVQLSNSEALAANTAPQKGLATTTVTPTGITMQNVTMAELLKTLNNEFYILLSDKTAMPGKYNFKLSKAGFEQLREELQQKYGLALQPHNTTAEQAIIRFK